MFKVLKNRELLTVLTILLALGAIVGSCDSPTRSRGPSGPRRAECWKHVPVNPDEMVVFADNSPQLSNSGEKLAFVSFYDSCNNVNPGIYIKDSPLAPKRHIGTFGSFFRWLPGDTEMIVNTGAFAGGQLMKFNLNTLELVDLNIQTRFPPFDVSRNGRFIYYEAEDTLTVTPYAIRQFDRHRLIDRFIGYGSNPAISTDGTMLAFASDTSLVIHTLSDSNQRHIPRTGRLAWLADGSGIVSSSSFGEVLVTDLSGSVRIVYGENSVLRGAFGHPDVSPDGRRVYFEKVGADTAFHIWSIGINGTCLRQETW